MEDPGVLGPGPVGLKGSLRLRRVVGSRRVTIDVPHDPWSVVLDVPGKNVPHLYDYRVYPLLGQLVVLFDVPTNVPLLVCLPLLILRHTPHPPLETLRDQSLLRGTSVINSTPDLL